MIEPGDMVKLSNKWPMPAVFVWGNEQGRNARRLSVGRFSRNDVGLVIYSSENEYVLILTPDVVGWINKLNLVKA